MSSQALSQMARIVRYEGDYGEAHRLLIKGAEANADDFNIQNRLAFLYLDIGLEDLAFNAARSTGTKARMHALTGDKVGAMKLLNGGPGDLASARAAYESGDYAAAYPFFGRR